MDLERWASKCAFGTYLDTAIFNQLVIGIPDVQLQLDLTDDDTLTKDQVLARIKHWDQTLREAASFQTALPAAAATSLYPSPVLAVSSSSFGPPRHELRKIRLSLGLKRIYFVHPVAANVTASGVNISRLFVTLVIRLGI